MSDPYIANLRYAQSRSYVDSTGIIERTTPILSLIFTEPPPSRRRTLTKPNPLTLLAPSQRDASLS
jgi:hypothetical protein